MWRCAKRACSGERSLYFLVLPDLEKMIMYPLALRRLAHFRLDARPRPVVSLKSSNVKRSVENLS